MKYWKPGIGDDFIEFESSNVFETKFLVESPWTNENGDSVMGTTNNIWGTNMFFEGDRSSDNFPKKGDFILSPQGLYRIDGEVGHTTKEYYKNEPKVNRHPYQFSCRGLTLVYKINRRSHS